MKLLSLISAKTFLKATIDKLYNIYNNIYTNILLLEKNVKLLKENLDTNISINESVYILNNFRTEINKILKLYNLRFKSSDKNLNASEIELCNIIFNNEPDDYIKLLDLISMFCDKMIHYYEIHSNTQYIVRDLKLLKAMIKIINNNMDLFEYDDNRYLTKNNELNYDYLDSIYHCLVYVNTKNISRFVKNPKNYTLYIKYPHELYILKAQNIFKEIISKNIFTWI